MAINGVGVYTAWHSPFCQEDQWSGEMQRGPLVKATIRNNLVTQRDTLFKDVAQYPALSFDGTRVAFFRWGVRLSFSNGQYHVVSGTENAPNYLSVINIDGTGLANLVQVSAPAIGNDGADKEEALLDWPAGDWIYYEKPTKTAEIWRINARDPSRNEKVCRYGPVGINLRRWDLSVHTKSAACQTRGGTNPWYLGGGCEFPLVNDDVALSNAVNISGCNQSVSCNGDFFGSYLGGNHEIMFINIWDHMGVKSSVGNESKFCWQNHWNQLETWLGEQLVAPGLGGADLIRWSANSEKWVIRRICWMYQGIGSDGTNSIAVNWIDKQAINMSKNPPPPNNPSKCADAGDVWIDFGAGNENMWEDVNGKLHFQPPINPINYTPSIVSIEITPPALTAGPGKIVNFFATAKDQFGIALASQPSFTWTVSGGSAAGTISAGGKFTAASSDGGPYTVTASSQGKSGTTTVLVRNNPAGLDWIFTTMGGTDDINQKSAGAPNISMFPIEKRGTATNFSATAAGGGDNFGLRFTGLIEIPSDGQYTFFLGADDAATLFIDEKQVTSCTYMTGGKSGQMTLAAGLHPVALDFTNGCCGIELSVEWQGPGITRQAVPNNRLFRSDGITGTLAGARMGASRPNAGILSISADGRRLMPDFRASGMHTIEIIDATGRVLKRFAGISSRQHEMPCGDLTPGIYIVKAAQ
jgi:hypothetical protein